MTELNPCPFCGMNPNIVDEPEYDYNGAGPPPQYALICDNCGAQGPRGTGGGRGDHAGARRDACSQWNYRADK